MHRFVALALLTACHSAPAATTDDASPATDATLDAAIPPPPHELCGNHLDDDGDGLVDEDCAPSMFAGVYAPGVATDPALGAIEAASGRPLSVLQTYHSTSATGVARIAPDLAAIFARGQIAHLNIEPDGYTPAQYAAPAQDPLAHDLAAMGDAVATALAASTGRMFLTFGAEMNGNWTTWGCLPAGQYIALYRAAHATVDAALVAHAIDPRRVRWVYGPNATASPSCGSAVGYYPGHDVVDLLGMSAYRTANDSVTTSVRQPIDALFTGLAYPTAWSKRRFVLLQTGSRDGVDRDTWIAQLFGDLALDPRVAGAIYFDAADWAVPTDGAGWHGLTTAIAQLPPADRALDGVFVPSFFDVAYGDTGFWEIQALVDHHVTSGCATAPARYCPDGVLHRRDAAIMIARAFGLPDGTGAMFNDLPADDPGYGAVSALVARGAMAGCTAAHFCPDDGILETELAAVIAALGGFPPATTSNPTSRLRAAIVIAHGAKLL